MGIRNCRVNEGIMEWKNASERNENKLKYVNNIYLKKSYNCVRRQQKKKKSPRESFIMFVYLF